ncbi:MAG: DNA polymerase III subunit delta [Acidobacteriota bacterium]
MKLAYSDLSRHLASGSLSPSYVITGEQDLLRELALKNLQAAALGEGSSDFNLDRFDGEKAEVEQVVGACNTFSLMGGRRVVVVRRARRLVEEPRTGEAKKGTAVETMLGYLQNPSPHSVLVLELERSPDARRSTWKRIRELATLVQCDPLTDGEMEVWIAEQAARRQLQMGKLEVRYLLEEFGSDLRRQLSELEKISLYAAGRRLEREELAVLLGRGKAQSIFRFTDAVADRDASTALRQLGRLLEEGEPPLRILALLDRILGQLLVAKELKARGGARRASWGLRNELARRVRVPPWVAGKLAEQADRFKESKLTSGLETLAWSDRMLKTSGVPARLILEGLVIAVCRGEAAVPGDHS